MSTLVIFKAINSEEDKKYLFEKVTEQKCLLIIKDKSDKTVPVKAVSMNSQGQIFCELTEGIELHYGFQEVLTATFSVNKEKYLIEASISPSGNGVVLTLFNLFHLQRRKNYRYTLPQNYIGTFKVKTLNYKQNQLECKLLDVSVEGCAMIWSMDMHSMHMEDTIDGFLCIGDRPPIPVQGYIKNMRMKSDIEYIIGVEFDHLAKASEEKIISTITELQRELYLKKTG